MYVFKIEKMKIELPDIKSIDINEIEKNHLIRLDGKYEQPPVLISIIDEHNEFPIAHLGGFSVLKGQSKGRKTTFLNTFKAAYQMRPVPLLNTILFHDTKRKMLWFDTEQAPYEIYYHEKIATKLAGIEKLVGLKTYYLRPFAPDERFEIISQIIDKYKDEVCFVVIDGILDLVNSMNSEEEATMITSWLLKKTENYNQHHCVIIHENYDSGKASGHVGSYLLRKAESIIEINLNKKDGRLSDITPRMMRKKKFPAFSITIDDNGLPAIRLNCNYEF